MQVVSVLIGSCKFCVCLFYRRPSNCAEVLDSMYSVLCNVDVSLFSHFVLIGDFIDFMSPRQPLFSMLQCITSSCHKLLPDPPITVTLVFHLQLTLPLYHIQLMLYLVPPFHLCQHLTTREYLSLIKYRHPLTNNHFLKKGSLVLLTQESK